jgi:lipoyl(octanoyl) transferase
MDLSPFNNINPCGFAKLPMMQIADFIPDIQLEVVTRKLEQKFLKHF